ncbi:MAG TPA: class I SAM-dependent methyltransferase [Mycobacterium sp.]|uniref:class I SAM-dependent methyltransferase n=1 Tax=Mycobacterium sp. TaxID=1785 RepID=UPI002D5E1942|nr:class I SAM-dependent methyltransferase [Mycobacterium sp.]HZU47784.1 class I SAM-dependent methyltransferase [Mycobacterium sp.]
MTTASPTDTSPRPGDSTYLLGHADPEVRRLLLQARLYDEHTEQALRLAGLRTGMRVLDVGCGPGDVSFVAAQLVGPTGTVLGVDAAPDIIELARARADERGLSSVRFEQTVIADLAVDEPVDAVIGRLILMHLPDPAAVLRQLAALVRPGGLIAFSEFDTTAATSVPDLPLWRAARDGIGRAFTGMGLDPAFGTTLHTLFQRAGLGRPRLTLSAPLGTLDDTDTMAFVAETWRSLFPVAQQLGLVIDGLADPDTLMARLRDEVAANEALVQMPALMTAWARV